MAIEKQYDRSRIDPLIKSFAPVADQRAEILILGSMPGVASLDAGQYYAHPQNLFWPLVGETLGLPLQDYSYHEKALCLMENRIALWDVLQSCMREGSLDSRIKDEIPNDLSGFLREHNRISLICFNGKKAEAAFHKYLRAANNAHDITAGRRFVTLPSTSPANASIPLDTKRKQWKDALLPHR